MDQHHFHITHRIEQMSRQERIAADEQMGRVAQRLFGLGQALARALRRRSASRLGAATMPARRSA